MVKNSSAILNGPSIEMAGEIVANRFGFSCFVGNVGLNVAEFYDEIDIGFRLLRKSN